MIVDVKTDNILLQYTCECGETSTQWLNEIVQNGTHTCDCGQDMQLDDTVQVRS